MSLMLQPMKSITDEVKQKQQLVQNKIMNDVPVLMPNKIFSTQKCKSYITKWEVSIKQGDIREQSGKNFAHYLQK